MAALGDINVVLKFDRESWEYGRTQIYLTFSTNPTKLTQTAFFSIFRFFDMLSWLKYFFIQRFLG